MIFLTFLNTFLVGLSAALSWLFIVRYAQLDWRSTDEGKHIMGFTLCVALFTTLATIVRVYAPPAVNALTPVVTLLYAWLTYLIASRNWLLYKAQKERDPE